MTIAAAAKAVAGNKNEIKKKPCRMVLYYYSSSNISNSSVGGEKNKNK
jgi:hypothetical protein